ncbi:MAG: hypothetical protein K0S43_2097, partial [Cellulosimicrobium sp.]|nr:hypothetical protein [Cellulosimicrobium sp.]
MTDPTVPTDRSDPSGPVARFTLRDWGLLLVLCG